MELFKITYQEQFLSTTYSILFLSSNSDALASFLIKSCLIFEYEKKQGSPNVWHYWLLKIVWFFVSNFLMKTIWYESSLDTQLRFRKIINLFDN